MINNFRREDYVILITNNPLYKQGVVCYQDYLYYRL
jgi:hypothetical protein